MSVYVTQCLFDVSIATEISWITDHGFALVPNVVYLINPYHGLEFAAGFYNS